MGKIFISAGHSQRQPGATSFTNTTEAQEMMQTRDLIVQELKSLGLNEGKDFRAVPDHLMLSETINWINSYAVNGDVALEIHGNAFNGLAQGTECFYVDGNSERKEDAELILEKLLQKVPELQNRGAKSDRLTAVGSLAFCRQVRVRSLLLELCFLDHKEDFFLLHHQRRQFAQGIAKGLIEWRDLANGVATKTWQLFPIIDIELNGKIYEDKGILVNHNSYIPLDLVNRLNINLPLSPQIKRVQQGNIVYVKAVELQDYNVSISWDSSSRTVKLDSSIREHGPINQIISKGQASEKQLMQFLTANTQEVFLRKFPNIARIYIEESQKEGVNHDIAFCQMCLETGYLKFGGTVSPSQNNFAGLGVTGGGVSGATFPDVRTGVKAHIQHLKAYASTEPIVATSIVDPRFHLVKRGIAPVVEKLSGYWAVDLQYGTKILALLKRLYEISDPIVPFPEERPVIYITQTNARYGELYLLDVYLVEKGAIIDKVQATSGQPCCQHFRIGVNSKAGSREPLPEGYWKLGSLEWASGEWDNYTISWPSTFQGLGPIWIEMDYVWPDDTERRGIGFHLDNNQDIYPGTAGCVGIIKDPNLASLRTFVSWFENPQKAPKTTIVDWGLGTVESVIPQLIAA
jgi:hypothetical protein